MKNNLHWLATAVVLFTLGGCASGGGAALRDDALAAADSAYQARDLKKAERLYRRLAKDRKTDADIYLRLGNIAMLGAEPNRAAGYYERAIAINPRHARAHYNLATIYLQRSEEHMHYFVALSDDSELNDGLVRLLAQIEQFSHADLAAAERSGSPLDELARRLAQDGGSP